MNKHGKLGFTLIELLAVIVILAAIMLIIIPLVTSNVKKGSEVATAQSKESIESAAENWARDNKGLLPEDGKEACISVNFLINAGYLDGNASDYKGANVIISNVGGVYYYNYSDDTKECPSSISLYRTLTYNYQKNGGSKKDEKVDLLPGSKVNLKNGDNSKKGYDFIGWNNNHKSHKGFTEFTMPSNDVTLYAIYKKKIEITFTVQNTSLVKASAEKANCKLYNNDGGCIITTPTLTAKTTGIEILGWSTKKGAASKKDVDVKAGQKITVSKDDEYFDVVKKLDNDKPTCTLAISPATPNGNNNWYNGKVTVTVTMKANDTGGSTLTKYGITTSDTATYNMQMSVVTDKNGSNIEYHGYVKDGVGNKGKCDLDAFKRDAEKPTCTLELSGAKKNKNSEWYTGDVTVTMTYTDSTSKVNRRRLTPNKLNPITYTTIDPTNSGTVTATYKKDGKKITYYGYVKDRAGNTNDCTISFKRDTTGPTHTSGGKASSDGSVTKATFTDSGSGVDAVYYLYKTEKEKPKASNSKWKKDRTQGPTTCGETYYVYAKAVDKAGNYTIQYLGSYNTKDCPPKVNVKILKNKYIYCPDNQEKHSRSECAKDNSLYNSIHVSNVKANGTNVSMDIRLHMNNFEVSYQGSQTRTLCFTRKPLGTDGDWSNKCYDGSEIKQWTMSANWFPAGDDKNIGTITKDVSNYKAGYYRLTIVGSNGGDKYVFTNKKANKKALFQITRN